MNFSGKKLFLKELLLSPTTNLPEIWIKTNNFKTHFFQSNMVSEIHALVSSAKPLVTWTCRDASQECRDACGGHGFLKSARFGDIRGTVDPCITYEGDNNVLVQQTSNWLLRQWQLIGTGGELSSPLGSCTFLKDHLQIKNRRYVVNGDVQTQKCK